MFSRIFSGTRAVVWVGAMVTLLLIGAALTLHFWSNEPGGNAQETALETGWLTYTDPQNRFTLQYPADWTTNGLVVNNSGQVFEITSPEKLGPTAAKIDIGIFRKTIDESEDLGQWLDAYNRVASDFTPDQLETHKRESIKINGLEAIQIIETSPMGDYQYTSIRRGKEVWFVWSNIGQAAKDWGG